MNEYPFVLSKKIILKNQFVKKKNLNTNFCKIKSLAKKIYVSANSQNLHASLLNTHYFDKKISFFFTKISN
jgi:hypothetical protein